MWLRTLVAIFSVAETRASIVHRGEAKVRVAGRNLQSESWVCLQKRFCLKVSQTPVAQEMP